MTGSRALNKAKPSHVSDSDNNSSKTAKYYSRCEHNSDAFNVDSRGFLSREESMVFTPMF